MNDMVHREVELPCSSEEAWQHVTDTSWLGDDGSLDALEGAEGWVDDGEETRYLVVEEVEVERRLVYRWASFTDAPTRVEIDLEPSSGGTRISITEGPIEIKALAGLACR